MDYVLLAMFYPVCCSYMDSFLSIYLAFKNLCQFSGIALFILEPGISFKYIDITGMRLGILGVHYRPLNHLSNEFNLI